VSSPSYLDKVEQMQVSYGKDMSVHQWQDFMLKGEITLSHVKFYLDRLETGPRVRKNCPFMRTLNYFEYELPALCFLEATQHKDAEVNKIIQHNLTSSMVEAMQKRNSYENAYLPIVRRPTDPVYTFLFKDEVLEDEVKMNQKVEAVDISENLGDDDEYEDMGYCDDLLDFGELGLAVLDDPDFDEKFLKGLYNRKLDNVPIHAGEECENQKDHDFDMINSIEDNVKGGFRDRGHSHVDDIKMADHVVKMEVTQFNEESIEVSVNNLMVDENSKSGECVNNKTNLNSLINESNLKIFVNEKDLYYRALKNKENNLSELRRTYHTLSQAGLISVSNSIMEDTLQEAYEEYYALLRLKSHYLDELNKRITDRLYDIQIHTINIKEYEKGFKEYLKRVNDDLLRLFNYHDKNQKIQYRKSDIEEYMMQWKGLRNVVFRFGKGQKLDDWDKLGPEMILKESRVRGNIMKKSNLRRWSQGQTSFVKFVVKHVNVRRLWTKSGLMLEYDFSEYGGDEYVIRSYPEKYIGLAQCYFFKEMSRLYELVKTAQGRRMVNRRIDKYHSWRNVMRKKKAIKFYKGTKIS